MKPFWALLVTVSTTFCNLKLIAFEIILYVQLSKDMGLQFLIKVVSPFLGISFKLAVLKLGVRRFLLKHVRE